jgi:uncharacterized protein
MATKLNRVNVVQVLLDHGANIEHQDNKGQTALLIASTSERDNFNLFPLLLNHDANLDHQDVHGLSALMWLCQKKI